MESSTFLWNNQQLITSAPFTFVFDPYTAKKSMVRIPYKSPETSQNALSTEISYPSHSKYKKNEESLNYNSSADEKNYDTRHNILRRSFKMRSSSHNLQRFFENSAPSSQWSLLLCDEKDVSLGTSFNTEVTLAPTTGNLSQQKILSYKPNVKVLSDNFGIWNNPVLGVNNQANLPSLASSKSLLPRKSFDSIYNTFSFSKAMLKKVIVFGQVDDKFISCIFNSKTDGDILVLVDQHAVHERIRLEKLLKQIGYYKTDEKEKHLKSLVTRLFPPAHICFCESEIDLVRRYQIELQEVGLLFSVSSQQKSSHSIVLRSIPCVFVNVCEYQPEAKGSVINSALVKDFILEQIKFICSTHGKCSLSSSTLFKAMASHACHGAIKFGDKLSLETCKKLMEELSECDLPFQCAHGRPSVAPLFKINHLNCLDKENSGYKKLNFSRLKMNK